MTEINLTPDFKALFDGFEREAKMKAETLANDIAPPVADTAEAWKEAKVGILRSFQGVLAPLAICAQAATTAEQFLRLREVLSYTLTVCREKADKLEASLVEPTWFRTADGYMLYLVDNQWVDSLDPDAVVRFDNEDGWPVDCNGNELEGKFIEVSK
jgi:hypothetical protein